MARRAANVAADAACVGTEKFAHFVRCDAAKAVLAKKIFGCREHAVGFGTGARRIGARMPPIIGARATRCRNTA
jgi:hypothetical protein